MDIHSAGGGELLAARFSGDARAQQAIQSDPDLSQLLEAANRRGGTTRVRHDLLATAVRVDEHLLTDLDRIMDDLVRRASLAAPLEFYVYSSQEMNGCVCRGRDRFLVMLSSGAVERLTRQEIEFVIGHELGHALYGHLEMPVMLALQGGGHVGPRQAMRLLAWQRKAEISADRAGLICCGSLEVASTAMFKLLSGLTSLDIPIDPQQFTRQWGDLAQEISSGRGTQHWGATHPFPTLRMRAMMQFWESSQAAALIDESAGTQPIEQADREIESMLAMMDPLARENGNIPDPMLAPFFLWGGLYIALANGALEPQELDDLRSLAGAGAVDHVLGEGAPEQAICRERFVQALSDRRKSLSALELHRVFSGLATIALADGTADELEIAAMRQLAALCEVSERFVDMSLKRAA